ncbi:hypothetical protein [Flavobacterium sp.]|jgi:hypothetical protein|uniref:hypothetical protein n=1 Tax=Flavobacterium sp. TaxID=239 RepID=UPI0037C0AAD1
MKTKTKQKDFLCLFSMGVDRMNKKAVNLLAIRRKFSPLLKTSMLGETFITLHLKNSKIGVRLSILEKVQGVYFISVKMSKRPDIELIITAKTNKELLTKLIYKYECFN